MQPEQATLTKPGFLYCGDNNTKPFLALKTQIDKGVALLNNNNADLSAIIGKDLVILGVEFANKKNVQTSKNNINLSTQVIVTLKGDNGLTRVAPLSMLWQEYEGEDIDIIKSVREAFPENVTLPEQQVA